MERTKILVVDDEETLCDVLKFNLEIEGYDVDVAYSAEEALRLPLNSYGLVLLDVMMGEISGFRMARMMRDNPATADVPIIFCTAKDTEDEMVAGLRLGADDYITKPYSIRNVLARVQTVLRRTGRKESGPDATDERIACLGLVIDTAQKRLTVDGTEVPLPKKELEILRLLIANPGRIFSRGEILTRVWPDEVVVLDRTVDVNITRLRRKLGEYGKHIITRPGYGYGFKA
ncbi:MAG: response regulator transcription factor [Prevotella sp.]|nr:response regulator transcription factor [Prevotella sp.]